MDSENQLPDAKLGGKRDKEVIKIALAGFLFAFIISFMLFAGLGLFY
jgi:hypothetical protein